MKIFSGRVTKTNMQKTATVAVERIIAHPVYGKRLKRIRKYHVHDEMGAKIGETVKFVACAPVSKLKKWKITEIVGREKKRKEPTKLVKAVKKSGKK